MHTLRLVCVTECGFRQTTVMGHKYAGTTIAPICPGQAVHTALSRASCCRKQTMTSCCRKQTTASLCTQTRANCHKRQGLAAVANRQGQYQYTKCLRKKKSNEQGEIYDHLYMSPLATRSSFLRIFMIVRYYIKRTYYTQ